MNTIVAEDDYCGKAAQAITLIAGYLFGDIMNFLFGDSTIVLVGEGENGEDLNFAATDDWMNANHASRLSDNIQEEAQAYTVHVQDCNDPRCVTAKARLNAISQYMAEGKPPGGAGIAILSSCCNRLSTEKVLLVRGNGWGDAIDQLKLFILWFTEDKDFWVWEPEEKKN